MKILVAGGAGYIGSRLVPALVENGHKVTVVDLLWFGNYLPKNILVYQKNIFSIKENFLKKFDQVIYLAGLSNDPMADFSPSLNFISNAAGPGYMSYIAKKAGVKRFIYADSCSVYGFTDKKICHERSKATSAYPYGISKLQGSLGALSIATKNFSVICLRQGTLSGFSPRMRFDLIINTMYMKAMTSKKIIVSNPLIWRPILAMSDAVNGYLKAIDADDNISGVFNLSSDNFTVGSVASEVVKYFQENLNITVEIEKMTINDMRNYRVSNRKSKKILGILYKGTVKSILDELHQHFGKNFNFKNSRLYNIKIFKKVFSQKMLSLETLNI